MYNRVFNRETTNDFLIPFPVGTTASITGSAFSIEVETRNDQIYAIKVTVTNTSLTSETLTISAPGYKTQTIAVSLLSLEDFIPKYEFVPPALDYTVNDTERIIFDATALCQLKDISVVAPGINLETNLDTQQIIIKPPTAAGDYTITVSSEEIQKYNATYYDCQVRVVENE